MRVIAVGDIHGTLSSFDTLLKALDLQPGDRLITLGDYVDRGPQSKQVLDRLIGLYADGVLTPLRGNHEIMMADARLSDGLAGFWMRVGGAEALASYGRGGRARPLDDIPEAHWRFLADDLLDYYETDTHIFAHAGLDAGLPMAKQTPRHLQWGSVLDTGPHVSGKRLVCGHIEQRGGDPFVLPHAICIDTWAYSMSGWLTGLDVLTGRYWQADQYGRVREGEIET